MSLVGVASVATSSVASAAFSGVGSPAGSGVDCHVGRLSKFFIGNNLPLKLLRTFALTLNNDPKLFKKSFFQVLLYLLQSSLIQ